MKGILKLTDIQSPVEGMQVVWADTPGFPDTKLFIRGIKGNKVGIVGDIKNLSAIEADLSELKQIVVEYESHPHAGISKKGTGPGVHFKYKETLPLHPDDWKWAIEHIGEGMEFEMSPKYTPNPEGKKQEAIAKLIHPTPVTYTEEEVENFLIDFANSVNVNNYKSSLTKGAIVSAWFDKHKKK